MARTKISEFSSNPATNTDIDSIFIGEGMAPSNVNDAIRELMAQLKDWQSGTSNDPYVVGSSGSLTLNQGTANGVAYLNGSKVVTSGSALSFDGTNLGVGTSSPAYKLQVTNTSASAFASVVSVNTGTAGILLGDTDSATVGRIEYENSSNFMALYTNGSERARLDSSGNLGLGVTPSAWSAYKAMQFAAQGVSVFGNTSISQAGIGSNGYYNGTNWIYNNSSTAAQYLIEGANHKWYTAASGTAGNAITFTQAMTLDASGNLGVGTTSPNSSSFAKAITLNGSTSAGYEVNIAGTNIGYLGGDSGQLYLRTSGANPLTFATNGTERARIDSSGNLLINWTGSATYKLFVAADSSGSDYPAAFNNTNSGSSNQIVIDILRNNSRTGYITNTNTTTSFTSTSDYRLKEDVKPMVNALAKVTSLKPVTYKWKVDGSDGQGFIAHELAEVVPDCVSGEKDAVDAEGNPKYQGIDTSFLVATLTAAIQELNAKFEAYKASHP